MMQSQQCAKSDQDLSEDLNQSQSDATDTKVIAGHK